MATPRKGKAEETPGYCKAEDLANLFALTGQWINQLTRDGVLKKRDTPAGKRYNVVESTGAYVQYLRDKAAGRRDKGIPESKELEKFEAEVRIKREVYLVMKDLSNYTYDPEKYAERVRERMDWKVEHEGEDDDE